MKHATTTFAIVIGCSMAFAGCKEDTAQPPAPAGPAATAPAGGAGHAGEGHHKAIPIGIARIGELTLNATTDGPVKPGGEGAFDVVIAGPKPKAVRFWVGSELGEGSVKAKADEESPNQWHTHVEVPDPLPAGSQFWVEVEPETGTKGTASFKLLTQ